MVFINALGGIFGLLLLGMTGYVLAGRGWFGAETRVLLPRLITCVALPPYLMSAIMQSFGRGDLPRLLQSGLLPLGSVALTFALAVAAGKLFRVRRQHFGLFCASISNSNTIFVGIPVNLALFGEEALTYGLLYYCASTVFFWTVGQYAITLDMRGKARAIPLRARLAQIFSPPLMGFLTGLALTLFNVRLPGPLQDAARCLGNLTTPLALIFIGISIYDMGLKSVKISKDMALTMAGRMLLAPLVMALLARAFSVPELMGKVFIMQASLPVMTQAAILSAHYRTDAEFGAQAVTLSTLLSMATIPLLMVLFESGLALP